MTKKESRRIGQQRWVLGSVLACMFAMMTSGCGLILGIEDLSSTAVIPETWSHRYGSANQQIAGEITTDNAGAILATGTYNGGIDFGGASLPSMVSPQFFVVKLDPGGNHLWSKRLGDVGGSPSMFAQLAVSGSDVFLGGSFAGSIGFGKTQISTTTPDIFAAKLNASGEEVWVKQLGGTGIQYASDVASYPNGDVVLAGGFMSNITELMLLAAGETDIFVTKLAGATGLSDGWGGGYGSLATQEAIAAAASRSGDVAFVGRTEDAFTFGSDGALSAGYFLANLSNTGQPNWLVEWGTTDVHVGGIVRDADGNIYVAGDFGNTITLGNVLTSAGGRDIFVARFNPQGAVVWSQQFGDFNNQTCWGLAMDEAKNLYLTGDFEGAFSFGGNLLQSTDGLDVYVAQLGELGDHRYSERFGGSLNQVGRSIAVDPMGNILLFGEFEGAIDFGQGELISASARDLFIAKFAPELP